jgi:outer membrane protein assembly factor BamB
MLRRFFVLAVVTVGLSGAARAADWPQWRGPERDGKSAETGLLKAWPAEGPTLLWKAGGCGEGFGSLAIEGGLVYVLGDADGKTNLYVLDANDGKPKGKPVPFAPAVKDQYSGARSTPTVEKGMVYVSAPAGVLACIDAKTLQGKWSKDYKKDFKGAEPGWKFADSPLVDGENVIIKPGGRDATIVAYNKANGNAAWQTKGLSDGAEYSSCIKVTVGDVPMIVTLTNKGMVGVSAKNGQPLWQYARPANGTANCPTPVAEGSRVFCASGYGQGGGAVDLKAAGAAVQSQQAWETKDMNCHHGGYVLVDGFLYGNNGGGWACLDWKSGETKYKAPGVGKGSIIYADGMLYCFSEGGGKVGLVKAEPAGHKIISQFAIPKGGQGSTWAHPAISDGRLYLRHGEFVYCYDIKDKAGGEKSTEPAK